MYPLPPLPSPVAALPYLPLLLWAPESWHARCSGGAGIPEMGGTLLLSREVNGPPTVKQGDQDPHLGL